MCTVVAATVVSMVATVASTAMSAASSAASGSYQQQQANYQAQVARNNAVVQEQQARNATLAGNDQALIAGQKSAAQLGAARVAFAASGVDPNTGTPVDVESDVARAGAYDQLTIRNNAARQALGYTMAAQSDIAQAGLDTAQGKMANQAGTTGTFGSILSGVSSLGNQALSGYRAGVFGGSGSSGTQQPGQ